jgi:hypothetical protein
VALGLVNMWHWDGLVAPGLCGRDTGAVVDLWHWECGGCVALGLWWNCDIGTVVDMWHWGCGGLRALGLWWICGTGTGVDMWPWGCGGHMALGQGFLSVLHCHFSNAANQSYIAD